MIKILLLFFTFTVSANYLGTEDRKFNNINPTSLLGIGATYTSDWINIIKIPAIKIWCKSNADINVSYRLRLVKN